MVVLERPSEIRGLIRIIKEQFRFPDHIMKLESLENICPMGMLERGMAGG